ncbi:MAG TPA: ResA-like WAxxUGC motif-containing protein, partial [Pseudomonadales bacterium]|nr:ResA-like WAxxUGC motif-containing protein [Pseudomonadales bacterium]
MWQALFEQYADKNVVLISVGLDALGAEACRPFIEAANPTHPSLIDQHHVLANLYGVTNIPQSFWIDENFMIVRPVESAPPPPGDAPPPPAELPPELPDRMRDILVEASKIRS